VLLVYLLRGSTESLLIGMFYATVEGRVCLSLMENERESVLVMERTKPRERRRRESSEEIVVSRSADEEEQRSRSLNT
jgi:hypothetical protein